MAFDRWNYTTRTFDFVSSGFKAHCRRQSSLQLGTEQRGSPQLRECHRDTGQVELFKFFQKHSIMPLEFFMLLPEIGKLQLEIGTLPLDKSRRELRVCVCRNRAPEKPISICCFVSL